MLPLMAVLALAAIGCVSTRVTSVRDPAFHGKKYQRVLVAAPFTDPEKKATAENAFVLQLQQRGVQAVGAMTLVPPTHDYTNDEIITALQQAGADSVLMVTMIDYYAYPTYVPGTTTTTTWKDPGYNIIKPRVAFEMKLVDVNTGGTAWLGASFTQGNAFAQWGTLTDSAASKAVAKMVADGALQ